MDNQALPNLALAGVNRRQLHFIFAVDTSGSMTGERIASLNYAVRAAIPAMVEAANDNPEIQLVVRVLQFSNDVSWPIGEAVGVHDFIWTDLQAGGETNMGAAFFALAEALTPKAMPGRQLPPVIVLLSDGLSTDEAEPGLAALLASEFGGKAVRVAIAIGADADFGLLQQFIANPSLKPLQAGNATALVSCIKWAASIPVKSASSPAGGESFLQQSAQSIGEANATAGDLVW